MKEGYQYEISEQEYVEQMKGENQVAITFLNNAKDVLLKLMDMAIAQHQSCKSEIALDRISNKLDEITIKMMSRNSEPKNYSK